ncbi:exo-alpha-sialidase neuraminidase [Colletotrichum tofieldiae]|uniref:Exo-alpha-sialidase neuraminidase n=1 Tax=Colletotrichum tofieldiae TaxID=708197 RepID=A0A161VK19_9PEZI|nr:exo-alpha-sialidase neuraminidase [Colletotrichum tofieldiae]
MTVLSLWHLVVVFSLITTISSLEVTSGSDCAALCLGGQNGTTTDTTTSGTNSSDIVCENDQYHSTGTGIKFKNCINCLQKSQATKGPESDAAWFMYNVRYAVDVCLFNFPDAISNINSPCIINSACLPLKNALTSGLIAPEAENAYDYCTADSDKFSSSSWWSCVRCLQSSESQSYLSNFLIALKAGCQRKPADGSLIGLTGQLFSEVAVNITDTATNTTMPGDGGASATTMTLGTIVGIAVGGGLVFVGAICLFIIYCRKQRKQKLKDKGRLDQQPPRSNGSSFTATNKSPYIPIGDHKKSSSIRSYNYELQEKQNTLVSNADYYDKLEQEIQSGREIAHYNFDPHSGHHGPGSAIPTHPAYIPRAMSRQSNRTNTPTPPNPRKTNTPDSYALQTYLNAVEDPAVSAIRPPPQAVSRTPSPARSQGSRSDNTAQPKLINIPPPPPGKTSRKGSARIPSLVLPSVPRIRVPKQYSPPQIVVEGATPVADRGEPGEMQISQPLTYHGERFQDRPLAGRPVISYVAPVRDIDPHDYESDMPIRSGKSTLYG